MKKVRKTAAQIEYSKELKRIKQFLYRAEKRGYIFPENIIPLKPKRITKASVRKLKKITPDTLYAKSRYGGKETFGEIISGVEGRKLERSARSKKASETLKKRKERESNISEDTSFFDNVVISNYRAHVSQFNEQASILLLSWLDRILAQHDKHDVAIMLEKGAENGLIVNYQIVYSNERTLQYMSNMLEYLPDASPIFKADLMDALEFGEDFEIPE